MSESASHSARFREARERVKLSPQDAADRMGISSPSLYDLESHDDELCSVYSPTEIQRFSQVLAIRPTELLGAQSTEPAILPDELARLIREHCQRRSLSIEQFEDAAGWHVAKSLTEPQKFLQDYTIDGIQDICRTLEVDWQRVILGL